MVKALSALFLILCLVVFTPCLSVADQELDADDDGVIDATLLPDYSGVYSAIDHDHDSDYAADDHDHSGTYVEAATTVLTKSEYLPIRYGEADDAVQAPADAAEVGTTTMIARAFDKDTDEGLVFWWHVPMDYYAGIKYRVYYALAANAQADETSAFSMAGCSVGNSDAIACTEGDEVVVTDELTTDEDTAELIVTGWSGAVTVTNIAVGEMAKLRFIRDVSGDDYTDDLLVTAIEIKYQAKLNASGDY